MSSTTKPKIRNRGYLFTPPEEDLLEGMIDQVNKTTAKASAAADKMHAFVEASNKRIDAMETQSAQQVTILR